MVVQIKPLIESGFGVPDINRPPLSQIILNNKKKC